MRLIIAVLAILAGFAAGAYFGGYDMLYLGIIHIVHGAQAKPVDGDLLAWGIVQVFVLWELVCAACVFLGFGLAALVGYKPLSQL